MGQFSEATQPQKQKNEKEKKLFKNERINKFANILNSYTTISTPQKPRQPKNVT